MSCPQCGGVGSYATVAPADIADDLAALIDRYPSNRWYREARAEITRLREALARSPEDAEWLRELAANERKLIHNVMADRLEAIANRISGVRE